MDKPPSHQEKKTAPDAGEHSSDYAPYPKIDPGDVEPPPRSTGPEATPSSAAAAATTMPTESNPYVTPSPVPASSSKATMDSVRDVLGKWGKKVGEATKKAEDLAGNVWQHLKTGPSLADTAMGRIAQGTKVIAEGGYEKIFQQTFDTLPEEQLKKSYACYLSTSAGPVMGTLYLSSAKLAFCSDTPLSYKVGDQTEWSYYKDLINGYELGILEYPHSETHYVLVCDKMPSDCHSSKTYLFPEDENSCARMVLIPLHQLRAVNPSTSKVNPSEKYIQIVSIDNHEFWFMGFVNYDSAVKNLQDALHESNFPR